MGITNTENTDKSLQKYDAVLEFIDLFKDVVGKNGSVPDSIRKDITTLRGLLKEHQMILDENNKTYAAHQTSYAAFSKEKASHVASVAEFERTKDITSGELLKREKAVRSREISSSELDVKHESISNDIIKREQEVTRREVACTGRELGNKKTDKELSALKSKLDIRYAALTKPLD